MTFDEHAARAALMDRTFDWRDGTYVANNGIGDYIDGVTLEVVTLEECQKRMSSIDAKHANVGMTRKSYREWRATHPNTVIPWITSGGNDDG